MNIYLSHDLESKLRKWAYEHNRTINSVIIEGLGKILITVDKTPEKEVIVNREVQNLNKVETPEIEYCEIGHFAQDDYSCSEEGTVTYSVPDDLMQYGVKKDKVILCKTHYMQMAGKVTTNA